MTKIAMLRLGSRPQQITYDTSGNLVREQVIGATDGNFKRGRTGTRFRGAHGAIDPMVVAKAYVKRIEEPALITRLARQFGCDRRTIERILQRTLRPWQRTSELKRAVRKSTMPHLR